MQTSLDRLRVIKTTCKCLQPQQPATSSLPIAPLPSLPRPLCVSSKITPSQKQSQMRLNASRVAGSRKHWRQSWLGDTVPSLPSSQRLPCKQKLQTVQVSAAAKSSGLGERQATSARRAQEHGPARGQESADDMAQNAASSAPLANLSSSSQAAPPPPPSSSSGSPLLWMGIGVALCVVVTRAASWLKSRMMKLAMEQMMKQMGGGGAAGSPFGAAAGSPFGGAAGSPFGAGGFPPPPGQSSYSPPPPPKSSPATAEPIDTTISTPAAASKKKPAAVEAETAEAPKVAAAVTSASPQAAAAEATQEAERPKKKFFQDAEVVEEANPWTGWSGYTAQNNGNGAGAGAAGGEGPAMTVEQLEQMLENPMIQNLVLQYLPEDMRNPETLKWMLQNPMMRKQLEEQMATLSQGGWGGQLGDMLNNPEVMKQYEEMGMTPEDAVKAVMGNPELAQAFQNPKIQAALLDCAKNPMNQMKYMNDKEVMDVFEKISRLFPQAGGP